LTFRLTYTRALGVLLYELLYGHSPWAAGATTQTSDFEVAKAIAEFKQGDLRKVLALEAEKGVGMVCSEEVGALLEALLAPEEGERLGITCIDGAGSVISEPGDAATGERLLCPPPACLPSIQLQQ
jgi:hypothetical protein